MELSVSALIMVNGRTLESDKIYFTVSISYILTQHGNGYNFSAARVVKADFMTLTDAIAHCIKSFGDIPEITEFRRDEY